MSMLQDMFDLDSCVESQAGMSCLCFFEHSQSVSGSVEKIRVGEADVLGPFSYLRVDVIGD
jgi:hypothetical protein